MSMSMAGLLAHLCPFFVKTWRRAEFGHPRANISIDEAFGGVEIGGNAPLHTQHSSTKKAQLLFLTRKRSACLSKSPDKMLIPTATLAWQRPGTYLGTMAFCGGGHAVDVWNISFTTPLAVEIPPASLLSVDSLTSAGAVIRNNTFNITTGSTRFKSSNSLITGNTFYGEGCTDLGCETSNLEISYLQCWFEGGAFIDNVTIANNTWHSRAPYASPVRANPCDTAGIMESGNRFMPELHKGSGAL